MKQNNLILIPIIATFVYITLLILIDMVNNPTINLPMKIEVSEEITQSPQIEEADSLEIAKQWEEQENIDSLEAIRQKNIMDSQQELANIEYEISKRKSEQARTTQDLLEFQEASRSVRYYRNNDIQIKTKVQHNEFYFALETYNYYKALGYDDFIDIK